jgi:hypothetical protein
VITMSISILSYPHFLLPTFVTTCHAETVE